MQPKRRADKRGALCAFYELALPSQRHMKYSDSSIRSSQSDLPRTYFNLQSAANPRWYVGFGPNTPKGLKQIGLRFSPQGHALSLPRRMGHAQHDKLVRPKTRCDFRFYSGIFKSAADSGDNQQHSSPWTGMLDKINELENHHHQSVNNRNQKGAFNHHNRKRKKRKYFTSKQSKNRISAP